MQVGERAFHEPALGAEPGAVLGAAAGDEGQAAVVVVVVAEVGRYRI